jgi:hypothetical protein
VISYIDVAIPGIFGLWLVVWPESMFYGSRVTPDETKIRRFRRIGLVLLVVAGLLLVLKVMRP